MKLSVLLKILETTKTGCHSFKKWKFKNHFKSFQELLFIYMYVYIKCLCVYLWCICVVACGGQKWVSGPLELELRVAHESSDLGCWKSNSGPLEIIALNRRPTLPDTLWRATTKKLSFKYLICIFKELSKIITEWSLEIVCKYLSTSQDANFFLHLLALLTLPISVTYYSESPQLLNMLWIEGKDFQKLLKNLEM